jgi:hypothetical protein
LPTTTLLATANCWRRRVGVRGQRARRIQISRQRHWKVPSRSPSSYFPSQLPRSRPPSLTGFVYRFHTTTMAAGYVTQAPMPTRDVYYSPVSDDDSDDDEFPPLEVLGTIGVELRSNKTLSGDFFKAWARIRERNHAGSWQPASLTVTNGRRIAEAVEGAASGQPADGDISTTFLPAAPHRPRRRRRSSRLKEVARRDPAKAPIGSRRSRRIQRRDGRSRGCIRP